MPITRKRWEPGELQSNEREKTIAQYVYQEVRDVVNKSKAIGEMERGLL